MRNDNHPIRWFKDIGSDEVEFVGGGSAFLGETISHTIDKAHLANRKVGICGQAPSDHPEFATFLVNAGIDSISLNPDSVMEVKQRVAEIEKKKR